MPSIADGFEFPELQKTIEDVRSLFGDIYDLTTIMNDQFNLDPTHDDRERRAELLAKIIGDQMEKLASKMCALTEFEFPRRMAA